MKLIIDIPEEDYKFIKEVQLLLSARRSGKTIERNVINAIKNGIPYEERPKSEWYYSIERGWHCSECDEVVKDMPTCMRKASYNFCPNCGAYMGKVANNATN